MAEFEITRRHDEQSPLGVKLNGWFLSKLTLKEAKKMRMNLHDAIEWATNMDDLRKEKHKPNANNHDSAARR